MYWAARCGNMEYLNQTLSTNEIDVSWKNPRMVSCFHTEKLLIVLFDVVFFKDTDYIMMLLFKVIKLYGKRFFERLKFCK